MLILKKEFENNISYNDDSRTFSRKLKMMHAIDIILISLKHIFVCLCPILF